MMSVNNREPLKQAIRDLRARTGLSYADIGERVGLDGSTIWKMEKTGRSRFETVKQLAEGMGEDVTHWLTLARFITPDDEGKRAEKASGGRGRIPDGVIGREESPQQYYERRLGELFVKYSVEGYAIPPAARAFGAGANLTEEDAEREVMAWLERLARANLGKPVPELFENEG